MDITSHRWTVTRITSLWVDRLMGVSGGRICACTRRVRAVRRRIPARLRVATRWHRIPLSGAGRVCAARWRSRVAGGVLAVSTRVPSVESLVRVRGIVAVLPAPHAA
jgi:hypothetical protein